MIETAGQLCSLYYGEASGNEDDIVGFAACENVRFKGSVEPGCARLMGGASIGRHTRRAGPGRIDLRVAGDSGACNGTTTR